MPKKVILFLLLSCLHLADAKAISFASDRLGKLVGYVGLQGLDTLSTGVYNTYTYKQHPLTVRVNRWGEIEHVGLLLFPTLIRSVHPTPVYDFLERYLLERNVIPANSEYGVKMKWDNVHFSIGNAAAALKIDTTAEFLESHVDLHVYKVAWKQGGRTMLEMSFDMDWQLMSGCNAIELAQLFFHKLRRYELQPLNAPSCNMQGFPANGTNYIKTGNNFASPFVRNDLYYSRKNKKDKWRLTISGKQPLRTLSNIMLSPEGDSKMKVLVKYDKYGLRSDSALVYYRAWQELCIEEGCEAYFGLKEKKDNIYRGTVFMVNRLGGYLHLLSINVPETALDGNQEHIAEARLYCYIPLHNVDDKILSVAEFEPIN